MATDNQLEQRERLSSQSNKKNEQKISASAHVAKVYDDTVLLLYGVVSYFVPQDIREEILTQIAQAMQLRFEPSGYDRYAKLLCLTLTHEILKNETRKKIPFRTDTTEIIFNDSFALLLRDRYQLSCKEIAAVIQVSEGSIRTKLERVRTKIFHDISPLETVTKPALIPIKGGSRASHQDQHYCITTRELIEDWDPNSGRIATPSCSKCNAVLKSRVASVEYFRQLQELVLPEKLKQFPVSPVFQKEGNRLLMNWHAAPWYFKALFEGLLATTLVVGIVLSIPRVKSLYEFWLERRIDLYSVAELASGLGGHSDGQENQIAAPSIPVEPAVTTPESGPKADDAKPEKVVIKSDSEFKGRDSEIISSDKVYRVLIKTDSPETLKERVLKSLVTVAYTPADEDAKTGAELPGGIIFDVFVPIKSYKALVADLFRLGDQAMGPPQVIITRAKERGVAGKARVKIWLQKI